MAEILELVDLDELRREVRDKYSEVARDPSAEYHFQLASCFLTEGEP